MPKKRTTPALLIAAKVARGIPTNYQLAQLLGVTHNTMTRWNQGVGGPLDPHAVRLAEMAGLDPGLILARLAAERATDPPTRFAWQQVARRLAAMDH